jgi:hypothetical protein
MAGKRMVELRILAQMRVSVRADQAKVHDWCVRARLDGVSPSRGMGD